MLLLTKMSLKHFVPRNRARKVGLHLYVCSQSDNVRDLIKKT